MTPLIASLALAVAVAVAAGCGSDTTAAPVNADPAPTEAEPVPAETTTDYQYAPAELAASVKTEFKKDPLWKNTLTGVSCIQENDSPHWRCLLEDDDGNKVLDVIVSPDGGWISTGGGGNG